MNESKKARLATVLGDLSQAYHGILMVHREECRIVENIPPNFRRQSDVARLDVLKGAMEDVNTAMSKLEEALR